MKDILPYLKPYRRRIALAMLLVAAATVCDLLLPTIMNDILNNGVRQSDFAYIVRCCAWMLAVAAAGLAALLAGRKISCDVVAGFNADLRTDVFSLVNNMTFEEFNSIGAAALLSRSTYDIGTVSWVASMISGSLITIPVLFFRRCHSGAAQGRDDEPDPAAVRPGDFPDRPAHQQAHRPSARNI